MNKATNDTIKMVKEMNDTIKDKEIARLEYYGRLYHLDVSDGTDISGMFYNSKFNADLSRVDTSNITNTSSMFANPKRKCNTSK